MPLTARHLFDDMKYFSLTQRMKAALDKLFGITSGENTPPDTFKRKLNFIADDFNCKLNFDDYRYLQTLLESYEVVIGDSNPITSMEEFIEKLKNITSKTNTPTKNTYTVDNTLAEAGKYLFLNHQIPEHDQIEKKTQNSFTLQLMPQRLGDAKLKLNELSASNNPLHTLVIEAPYGFDEENTQIPEEKDKVLSLDFNKFKKLRVLKLDYPMIRFVNPDSATHLSSLKILNGAEPELFKTIHQFPELTTLDIIATQLYPFSSSVTDLRLRSSEVKDNDVIDLARFPNLSSLTLQGLAFSKLGTGPYLTIEHLQIISQTSNDKNIDFSELFPNLKTVEIRGFANRNFHFSNAKKLKSIIVDDCQNCEINLNLLTLEEFRVRGRSFMTQITGAFDFSELKILELNNKGIAETLNMSSPHFPKLEILELHTELFNSHLPSLRHMALHHPHTAAILHPGCTPKLMSLRHVMKRNHTHTSDDQNHSRQLQAKQEITVSHNGMNSLVTRLKEQLHLGQYQYEQQFVADVPQKKQENVHSFFSTTKEKKGPKTKILRLQRGM